MLLPNLLLLPPTPPNIVLILADDLGFSDIGCFGSEIKTPHLDELRKGGVALSQFYNQARCCPTRAALLTGKYPHQVGIGDMIDDYAAAARKAANSPSYQDHLSTQTPTLAEYLKKAGYSTWMVGKWHLGKRPEEWPAKRGFDHSLVQINGAMNYYGSYSNGEGKAPMALDDQPFNPPSEGFYSTRAFADKAIDYLDQAAAKKSPFFMYLPFNASHWPLQAPESETAKYKGVYDEGFQVMRTQRLARMKSLGLFTPEMEMAPMDRGQVKAWNQMSPEEKAGWSRRMEVFAAQTSLLDEAVGRVVDELKRLKLDDNTLVIFLSDNGGAAEDPNSGDAAAKIGDRDSYRGYGRPWASVSNTPWKRHKVSAYEGGISSPFIVRWPNMIPKAAQGTWVRSPAHIIDLVPTLVAAAGGSTSVEGSDIREMLLGKEGKADRTFCWEHEGNRAIRKGKWKLVALPGQKWELYDIENDRLESKDLATEKPEVVTELEKAYQEWATRCGVIEWTELQRRIKSGG